MPQVLMAEAPGGLDAYQCPYCSHTYLALVVDESGQITQQMADPPRACRRCGSPMDLDKAQEFQDAAAVAAATRAPRSGRRIKKL